MSNKSFPTYDIERTVKDLGYQIIAGVDESARGCLAGPVAACAVRIPIYSLKPLTGLVRDSKKLSAGRREALCKDIVGTCEWGLGVIDNRIIDEVNILEATKLAMRMALKNLGYYEYVLVDGNMTLDINTPQKSIIRGDNLSISIAAASIVAKVVRDNIMIKLHKQYPQYNWKKNKGYGTKEHREAIKEHGPCEYHRFTFKGVK